MKTTNETTMTEQPTTFELAQLALTIQQQTGKRPEKGFADAVNLALGLWDDAAKARGAREEAWAQLKNILRQIFTATPKEWQAHIAAYSGHQGDIAAALNGARYPQEQVQRALFKDSSLTSVTRKKLFMGLPRFAITHGVEPPPGRTWAGYEPQDRALKLGEDGLPMEGITGRDENGEPCRAQNLAPLETVERDISEPMLCGPLCRWLADVRQRQLSESKKRDLRPSHYYNKGKGSRDKGEASIQFKKPHKA